MRIALVVPGFSRDAGEWAIPVLQELAFALSSRHEVEVFSLRYPPAGRYQVGPLPVWASGGGRRFGLASLAVVAGTVRGIARRHRHHPFDIIHAFWADEPGLAAALAGRVLGLPSLATLAGGELVYLAEADYGSYGSAPRRILTRLSLAMVKGITTASDYQAALAVERGVPPEKLTRVNLGVNTHRFQPGSSADPNRPVLLQAASLVPVKNQALLLEVLGLVSQTLPEVRLLLAGDGPLRGRLALQARAQGLDGRVVWLGRRGYPEMPGVYHQAHLYVHTSRHESGPMAVVEAMACGLPVIGTPVGLLPEVASLPASLEASALAEESIAILGDAGRYQALSHQARGRVESAFSLEQTASNFEGLYTRLRQGAGR